MRDPAEAAHLDPAAREALRLPSAQRLARIDRDLWIGYGRALEIGTRLEQILANLLRNAVRHTPPGGIVVMRARPAPPACEGRRRPNRPGIR